MGTMPTMGSWAPCSAAQCSGTDWYRDWYWYRVSSLRYLWVEIKQWRQGGTDRRRMSIWGELLFVSYVLHFMLRPMYAFYIFDYPIAMSGPVQCSGGLVDAVVQTHLLTA